MIYQPFTIDSQILLDAIHRLTEGPPGLAVRMRLTVPGEDYSNDDRPRRVLQATMRDQSIVFDIIDGPDLDALIARHQSRDRDDG